MACMEALKLRLVLLAQLGNQQQPLVIVEQVIRELSLPLRLPHLLHRLNQFHPHRLNQFHPHPLNHHPHRLNHHPRPHRLNHRAQFCRAVKAAAQLVPLFVNKQLGLIIMEETYLMHKPRMLLFVATFVHLLRIVMPGPGSQRLAT